MNSAGPVIHHRSFYTNVVLMEHFFLFKCVPICRVTCVWKKYIVIFHTITLEIVHSHPGLSYSCNHQFSSDNGLAMRRNISNELCVVGAPLFGSTLAPRRSIAFRNSAGTWSRVPGKQFGVLGRWRDRHTWPARWSDTLRIRPVRWRKSNLIRIDLARLADPIDCWLEWPVGLIHADHAWSPPGIISKMTRRLVEFWISLNPNST